MFLRCLLPALLLSGSALGQGYDLRVKITPTGPAPAAAPAPRLTPAPAREVYLLPPRPCESGQCRTVVLAPARVEAPVILAAPPPVILAPARRFVLIESPPVYEVRTGPFGRQYLKRVR